MELDQLLDPQRLADIWSQDDRERPDAARLDTTQVIDREQLADLVANSAEPSVAGERSPTDAPTSPAIELFVQPELEPQTKTDVTLVMTPEFAQPTQLLRVLPEWPASDESAVPASGESAVPATGESSESRESSESSESRESSESSESSDPGESSPLSAEQTLDAFEQEISALFADDSETTQLVHQVFDPIREAWSADDVSADQLDELEELLDALLAANGWPAGSDQRETS